MDLHWLAVSARVNSLFHKRLASITRQSIFFFCWVQLAGNIFWFFMMTFVICNLKMNFHGEWKFCKLFDGNKSFGLLKLELWQFYLLNFTKNCTTYFHYKLCKYMYISVLELKQVMLYFHKITNDTNFFDRVVQSGVKVSISKTKKMCVLYEKVSKLWNLLKNIQIFIVFGS